jgi:alkyl hydroperoxide reductase subunit AhpC
MTDRAAASTDSNVIASRKSNPFAFIAVCGGFMLAGLMFLVWLGTDRRESAEGKPFPAIQLDPLVNATEPFVSSQLKEKLTVFYIWSPDSKTAVDELKTFAKIAAENSKFEVKTIAYSTGSLIVPVLQQKAKETLDNADLDWPTYVDTSDKASMAFTMLMPYGSFGFPTIFVTDRQGTIRFVCEAKRPENWKELSRRLAKPYP